MPEVAMEESRSLSIHIPTEVCENIIDMLCALVCRDWRIRSQRMLFYQVQLADTTSFQRLSRILDVGPHLRDYVYKVELTRYHLHKTTSIFALFPAVFSGKLPNLYRIEAVHNLDIIETQFPRTPGSTKAKALPYIPLHPRFPAFLSAFRTVSVLYLGNTTFRTFSEFVRMLHGIPNLEELICHSVRWIAPGGSHPGADFTRQPEWVAGKSTLPPFAPKLRELNLWDISLYGTKRLIWTHTGPHLTMLSLTIPLFSDSEELSDGRGLDLGSCTGLKRLHLYITSQFSMDTHGEFVAELLASWKLQHWDPVLYLTPYSESETTRLGGFAETLRGLGTITEAWLQAFEEPPPTGSTVHHQQVKCQVGVVIHEWESRKRWWLDHLDRCFPTFMKLGRVELILLTPRGKYDEWADEPEPAQSGVMTASQVKEVQSGLLLKDTPSPEMPEHA